MSRIKLLGNSAPAEGQHPVSWMVAFTSALTHLEATAFPFRISSRCFSQDTDSDSVGSVLITQSVLKVPTPQPHYLWGQDFNTCNSEGSGQPVPSLRWTFQEEHGLENSFGKEAGKLGEDPEWGIEGRFAFRALAELKADQEDGVISANVQNVHWDCDFPGVLYYKYKPSLIHQ